MILQIINIHIYNLCRIDFRNFSPCLFPMAATSSTARSQAKQTITHELKDGMCFWNYYFTVLSICIFKAVYSDSPSFRQILLHWIMHLYVLMPSLSWTIIIRRVKTPNLWMEFYEHGNLCLNGSCNDVNVIIWLLTVSISYFRGEGFSRNLIQLKRQNICSC